MRVGSDVDIYDIVIAQKCLACVIGILMYN